MKKRSVHVSLNDLSHTASMKFVPVARITCSWKYFLVLIALSSLVFYVLSHAIISAATFTLLPFSIFSSSALVTPDEYIVKWWIQDKKIDAGPNYNATVLAPLALRYFFAPKLNSLDKRNFLTTLKVCLDLVDKVQLPYFLFAGSLIGFYRHNKSLIPWDDDVDLALLTTSSSQFPQYVTKLEEEIAKKPGYQLFYDKEQYRLKCFCNLTNNSYVINNPLRPWRWPFIDFQFMHTVKSYRPGFGRINFIQDISNPSCMYPEDWVYPLKEANFTEYNIPVKVPNEIPKILAEDYDIEFCRSSSEYNHRIEHPSKHVVSVPCTALVSFVNFTNLW